MKNNPISNYWIRGAIFLLLLITNIVILTPSTKANVGQHPKQSNPQSQYITNRVKVNENEEKIWTSIVQERRKLESEARRLNSDLHATMSKIEFNKHYPHLLYGKSLNSEGIYLPNTEDNKDPKSLKEIRIAYLAKNLTRENLPYCVVGLLIQRPNGKLEYKIEPDTKMARQILNISANWREPELVVDLPKFIEK